VLQRCSDVVEYRVEHAIRCRKPQELQLLLRIRNSPGALALGARPSDDDSPRRVEPFYRPVRRLVNRSSVNKQIDFLGERTKKGWSNKEELGAVPVDGDDIDNRFQMRDAED
jgi:hypothetical protein